MLVAQAEALDVLFYSYLSKASASQDVEAIFAWLVLAAKASSVCREALGGLGSLNHGRGKTC